MSASFYDLLKYAATGISSPSMTYYDRMRARTLMGGVVQTLTGIPPLSFPSDGSPITVWSMKGNGQQTGTPSPQSIIMPNFCGVRTKQIIDYTLSESGGIDASGNPVAAGNLWRSNVFYEIHGSIVLSFVKYSTLINVRVNYYDANYSHISREEFSASSASGVSLTIPTNAKYFKWTLYASSGTNINVDFVRQCYIMFNLGSTALPYEPYGFKLPLTVNGTEYPIYLGQVETTRRVKKLVLTGEETVRKDTNIGRSARYYIAISGIERDTTNLLSSHFTYSPWYEPGTMKVYVNTVYFSMERSQYPEIADFKSYLSAQYAAGTPVTVWYVIAEPETAIVNEPLAKIGDYADELHSEDAGVTIPTAKGENTLTVDTELPPSEMTITFKG